MPFKLALKGMLGSYLAFLSQLALRKTSAYTVESNMSMDAGVYTTSTTPPTLPWNTYNYCNAPHVNADHYSTPAHNEEAELVYLNVVMRHHKVRV